MRFFELKKSELSEYDCRHRLTTLPVVGWVLLSACAILAGCSGQPEFRFNEVELEVQNKKLNRDDEGFDPQLKQEISNLVTALFGTPNEPMFPFVDGEEDPAHDLLEFEKLRVSAGPVSSERDGKHLGLYREHCAQCHGITGDGQGPTSGFLNPYPRDFRMGRFKFKSTNSRTPPTDGDLKHVIMEGIPGTAMPSFKLLDEAEVDALIDYVKYLSIRGQFERELINQIGEGSPLTWPEDKPATEDHGGPADEKNNDEKDDAEKDDDEQSEIKPIDEQVLYFVDEVYFPILESWLDAQDSVTKVDSTSVSLNDPAVIAIGKELFLGKANCAQCHGLTGLGDGQQASFDLWTTTWVETPGVDKDRPSTFQNYIEAGAFPPRPMKPRNLRLRVFRGGNQPEDVFRRIKNGIDGTPMPAASSLQADEIWALVAYVLNMPDEPLSGFANRPKPSAETNPADSGGSP